MQMQAVWCLRAARYDTTAKMQAQPDAIFHIADMRHFVNNDRYRRADTATPPPVRLTMTLVL